MFSCFFRSSSTFISDKRNKNSAQRGKQASGKSKKQKAKSTLWWVFIFACGNNGFAQVSKNLAISEIILLAHQNNYVGNLRMMSNAAKNFDQF